MSVLYLRILILFLCMYVVIALLACLLYYVQSLLTAFSEFCKHVSFYFNTSALPASPLQVMAEPYRAVACVNATRVNQGYRYPARMGTAALGQCVPLLHFSSGCLRLGCAIQTWAGRAAFFYLPPGRTVPGTTQPSRRHTKSRPLACFRFFASGGQRPWHNRASVGPSLWHD